MKNTKLFNRIVRTEVFALLGVFLVLLGLYVHFFLEFHIKRALEKSAFESIGAEVNIESVNIDFKKPSVKINRIQITNPDKPEQNILEIKSVLSDFSYAPLFKGSFISDLTNVIGIEFHTKRSSPGRVLPEEKRILILKDPSQNKVQDVLKSKFKKTAFSDLVSLFSKDKRREIEKKYKESLESLKISSAVENQVKVLQERLKKTEDNIVSGKVKVLLAEVKAFRFDSSSTSKSIKSIERALALSKKLKKEKKLIQKELKAIRNESDAIRDQLKKAPATFLADVGGVGQALSPKGLSSEKLTEDVLGEYFSLQLDQVGRAVNSLKNDALGSGGKYVDLDSGGEASQETVENTDKISQVSLEKKKEKMYSELGRDFIFYKEAALPKYWLKKINIISKAHEGQDFGDITGFIQDLTDAPQITRKEMVIKIDGSVPKQGIGLFKIDALINHIDQKAPKESIHINVSDYLVKGLELFGGSDEWIKILKSKAETLLNVELQGEEIKIELLQKLKNPDYGVFAEDEYILKLFEQIKSYKEPLTFKLRASGDIQNPKVRISSNFGAVILRAVKANLSSVASEFAADQLSRLDGVASEKLAPYLKDIDLTSAKADDLKKNLNREISKSLDKLKSGKKVRGKDLLKNLLKF